MKVQFQTTTHKQVRFSDVKSGSTFRLPTCDIILMKVYTRGSYSGVMLDNGTEYSGIQTDTEVILIEPCGTFTFRDIQEKNENKWTNSQVLQVELWHR